MFEKIKEFTNRPSQREWIKMKLIENYHGENYWIPVQDLRWIDYKNFKKKFIHSFTARISELRRQFRKYGLDIKCKREEPVQDLVLTHYRLEIYDPIEPPVEDFTTY